MKAPAPPACLYPQTGGIRLLDTGGGRMSMKKL